MKKMIAMGMVSLFAVSCGGSKEAAKEEPKNTPTAEDPTSPAAVVGTLALSDMKLAESINPPFSKAVLDSSSSTSLRGMNLTAGGKSLERCLLQEAVSEVKTNVSMVSSQLCSLEKTPGMAWGGKYNIKFPSMGLALQNPGDPGFPGDPNDPGAMPGGDPGAMPGGDPGAMPGGDPGAGGPGAGGPGGDMPEMPTSMQVYMDNSVKGKHSVYVCQDKKLTQVIHIDEAKKGSGTKGSYAINMEMGSFGGVQISGKFDNGVSTDGRYLGEARMRFSAGDMKASSIVKMDLGKSEADIAYIQSARETAFSFDNVSESIKGLIAGRIGPDFGMAVVQSNEPKFGPEGSTGPKTAESYFNVAGQVVESSASSEFADGGKLNVGSSDLPKLLPADYKVELTGWDCSGTTDIDMSASGPGSEDIDSCYADMMSSAPSFGCFGGGFDQGMPVPDAPVLTGDDNRFEGDDFSSDGLEVPPPPPAPPAQ